MDANRLLVLYPVSVGDSANWAHRTQKRSQDETPRNTWTSAKGLEFAETEVSLSFRSLRARGRRD